MILCERFPSLNPLSLEEYPAEKVFMMIGNLLKHDKNNSKGKSHKNNHDQSKNNKKTSVKVLPSKRNK